MVMKEIKRKENIIVVQSVHLCFIACNILPLGSGHTQQVYSFFFLLLPYKIIIYKSIFTIEK